MCMFVCCICVQVLRFDQVSDIHSHLHTLMGKITAPSSSHVLNLANRLFGEKNFSFSPVRPESQLKCNYHLTNSAKMACGYAHMNRYVRIHSKECEL